MDQKKFDWAFQNKGLQNSYAHYNCILHKIIILIFQQLSNDYFTAK